MQKKQPNTSCLIISYGPVPTPQYQTVEGGGMRAWGLAEGLKSHGIDVTVGINSSFIQELSAHEGINLVNWNLDDNFVALINSFDTVVISYCMGDPSTFVVDHISDDVQLVLDAYVPIYIEVSARDSQDIKTEYTNYMSDMGGFNKVLARGDFFLTANAPQDMLYSGVLSALGVINPRSYRETRIVRTPFGIHRTPVKPGSNPYKKLGIHDDDFVVLWFGGIYPWFHIEEYLDAIKILSADKKLKFVFVGGKNPFNPNPDFSRQYESALTFSKENKLHNTQMFFVDWVDFDKRVDWFSYAKVVVSLNQPGEENTYSWRTRVMDFVWGEIVTITNGSDPLSEELLENEAAIRIKSLSKKDIVDVILSIKKDTKKLAHTKKQLLKIKETYYWDIVTKNISKSIKKHDLPYQNEKKFRSSINMTQATQTPTPAGKLNKMKKIVSADTFSKIRQKGIRRSMKLAGSIAKTQITQSLRSVDGQPQYVFISHPINNTGAPIVLLQMVEEFVQKYGSNRVRVIAPGVEEEQEKYLKKLGITVEKAAAGMSLHFVRAQLALKKNDFVIMNTIAIYDNYRDFILLWLKTGRLKHAYWFIHEDTAQIPVIHKEFLEKKNIHHIQKLTKSNQLTLLFPSKRTELEYIKLLEIPASATKTVGLHVDVDDSYKKAPTEAGFASVDFLISGTPSDGRKGQMLALMAFYRFLKDHFEASPSSYRPFKLHLVAIGDDYLSQQIKWISQSVLQKHVVLYPSLPKNKALEVTAGCNAVICCSLNETFGLYVAEGMQMGHIVLRNNSAGMDEQLRDGKNGYFIDHTDIEKFTKVIEKILNKKKTSNKDLQKMGITSQKMIRAYGENSYLSYFD